MLNSIGSCRCAFVVLIAISLAGPLFAQQTEKRVIRRSGSSTGGGGGSEGIRRTERRIVRDRDGAARERMADHDVRVRRIVPYGTQITRLPVSAKPMRIRDRDYYHWDDTYYVPIGGGSEVTYVVTRPPTGARLRFLPDAYEVVELNGRRYYFCDDVYYERTTIGLDTLYTVVEPPLGGFITQLPESYVSVTIDGERLICIGDEYYRAVIRRGVVVYIRVPAPRRTYETLSGVIVYRERIALPPDAEAEIRLLDITRPGRPPEVIAEQSMRRIGQVPIPFRLRYCVEDIDPRNRYALQAFIRIDGDDVWVNDTLTPVLDNNRRSGIEILVERSRRGGHIERR